MLGLWMNSKDSFNIIGMDLHHSIHLGVSFLRLQLPGFIKNRLSNKHADITGTNHRSLSNSTFILQTEVSSLHSEMDSNETNEEEIMKHSTSSQPVANGNQKPQKEDTEPDHATELGPTTDDEVWGFYSYDWGSSAVSTVVISGFWPLLI